MPVWDAPIETWPQDRLRETWEALEALLRSPGWEIVAERAESEREGLVRRIEQGDPTKHAQLTRDAGQAFALRRFTERPQEIIAKARAVYAEREERAAEQDAQEG